MAEDVVLPPWVTLTPGFVAQGLPGESATGFVLVACWGCGVMRVEVRRQRMGVKPLLLLVLELELRT